MNMKIIEKAMERFALPAEALGHGRLILSGDSHLLIENHRGILEYSEEKVVLALKRGRISISGSKLKLCAMNSAELLISGRIENVEWM